MKTALVIGDIQRGITGAYPFARQVIPPLTELLPRARAADVLVVFDNIAVAGVATGAMVAATCYDAADRGYRVTVLRDGCADHDPAMHDFFMDKVFPSRAHEVVSCATWLV